MKKEVLVATVAVVGTISTLTSGEITKDIKSAEKIKTPVKGIKKEPIAKKEVKGFKKKELDKIFGVQDKVNGVASRSYGWDKVVPNR